MPREFWAWGIATGLGLSQGAETVPTLRLAESHSDKRKMPCANVWDYAQASTCGRPHLDGEPAEASVGLGSEAKT